MTESVSPELPGLLRAARRSIEATPLDMAAVHESLRELLSYLASPAGRTHANVLETDVFFSLQDDWSRCGDDLPEPYAAIVWDIGGQLHDTIRTPEVAANFESTPEQLLARLDTIEATERET